MCEEDELALKNEIDILSQVDHPNVVKMIEIFDNEATIHIVMELLTGGEVTKLPAIRSNRRKRTLQRKGGIRHHTPHHRLH
jgi:serine/threonine protein kinase